MTAGGLLSLLTACHASFDNPSATDLANRIIVNDFEAVSGWVHPDVPSLSIEQAHSGRWSVRVGPGQEYGYGCRLPLAQASAARPSKLRLRAWFFRSAPELSGGIAVKITKGDTDEKLQFETLGAADVPVGAWTARELTFPLDARVTGADHLEVFAWGPGLTGPLYVDDVELSAVK